MCNATITKTVFNPFEHKAHIEVSAADDNIWIVAKGEINEMYSLNVLSFV